MHEVLFGYLLTRKVTQMLKKEVKLQHAFYVMVGKMCGKGIYTFMQMWSQ